MSKLLFRRVDPSASATLHQVVVSDANGGQRPIAFIEPDQAPATPPRSEGGRSYVIWQDPGRQACLATVRTRGDSVKRHSVYEVYGVAGDMLGTITYRKATAFPPQRTQWIIEQPGQASPVVAKKGRVIWWAIWYLCFPLMIVTVVIAAFGSGDGVAVGTPKRLIWRRDREPALDFRPFRDVYRSPASWLDPRLATALIALHQSRHTEAFLNDATPWDPAVPKPS